jgi:hypothetical protein
MTPNKPAAETGAEQQRADGRDAKGQFAVGNAGGPSHPIVHKFAALQKVLVNSSTADDIQRIAQVLMDKAKKGDLDAAKLIIQVCLGNPREWTDPEGIETD